MKTKRKSLGQVVEELFPLDDKRPQTIGELKRVCNRIARAVARAVRRRKGKDL